MPLLEARILESDVVVVKKGIQGEANESSKDGICQGGACGTSSRTNARFANIVHTDIEFNSAVSKMQAKKRSIFELYGHPQSVWTMTTSAPQVPTTHEVV